jgi:iron complex transport system ATP-binding protein
VSTAAPALLEGREVRVRYPGAAGPALDGVTVRIEPRSLVALCGPNGGGKTTLVRALLGTAALQGGEVLLDGRPVRQWPRAQVARRVAVVTQREEPWVPLRVSELVLMGRYPRLGALSPVTAEDRVAVRRALERCDAWHLRDRRVDELSGGEWQRVRIARALAQDPQGLVLDEPGASLDIRHEMEVMELLRELVNGGLAGLLVTHHINLAARFADRMILLDRGRVVAAGSPADVLREDVLSRVFQWPLAVSTGEDGVPQLAPLRRAAE